MCQFIALFLTQVSFVQVKSKNAKLDMIHFTQITHPSPTAIIWAMENHTSASSLTEQGRQRDIEREGERESVCVGVSVGARERGRKDGGPSQPSPHSAIAPLPLESKKRDRETEIYRERERVCV